MTESELYSTSLEWEGGSPSVFFRPMNPALSAQNYFPDDSPIYVSEKENWNKRCGVMLTPASPLFGSLSYMSQESSCCSALNNAVIMEEEDDTETIPTDEKILASSVPILVPEDVSPIVLREEKSFNVSDLVPNAVGNPEARFPHSFGSDGGESSLQEFLRVQPAQLHVSSPPQWSPGIRASSPAVPEDSCVMRIEATLNFLDGMPTTSPKKRDFIEASSLSLSAINPVQSSSVQQPSVEEPDSSSVSGSSSVVHQFVASPVRIISAPARSLTLAESRTSIPLLEPLRMQSEVPGKVVDAVSRTPLSGRLYGTSKKAALLLSSVEQELRAAEDGRRRVIAQIRSNRRNFERLANSSSSFLDTPSGGRRSPMPPPTRPVSSVGSFISSLTHRHKVDRRAPSVPLNTSRLSAAREDTVNISTAGFQVKSRPFFSARVIGNRQTSSIANRPAWRF